VIQLAGTRRGTDSPDDLVGFSDPIVDRGAADWSCLITRLDARVGRGPEAPLVTRTTQVLDSAAHDRVIDIRGPNHQTDTDASPITNHQARRLPIRDDRGLLLRPSWPTEQQSGARSRSGDIAEVESNRPKSPEAFDFTQTEAAIVWSGSGVVPRHRSIEPAGPD
jgi:hypothetical protein